MVPTLEGGSMLVEMMGEVFVSVILVTPEKSATDRR
jgi:hypothetical protein